MVLDGYEIIRELHASNRTQIYLALDTKTDTKVVLKTPSVNFEDNPEYIDRFLHEEWAGNRIKSPHVLKVLKPPAKRQCLYYVTEYIEGQTLRQRMNDHRALTIDDVRDIVGQLATRHSRLSPTGNAPPGLEARKHLNRRSRNRKNY